MSKTYKIGSSTAMDLAFAPAMEINPSESRTIVAISLTANATLELGSDGTPQIGDEIIVKASSDGVARDLEFTTGMKAPILNGTANRTKVVAFVFDGTEFIATAPSVEIG